MLIVINESTVLNVDKIISLLITYTPETSKTLKSKGFLGLFPTYETKNTDKWTLKFHYINTVQGDSTYTSGPSDSYAELSNKAKQIIVQLRKYDSTMVDKAFEDAFLKG